MHRNNTYGKYCKTLKLHTRYVKQCRDIEKHPKTSKPILSIIENSKCKTAMPPAVFTIDRSKTKLLPHAFSVRIL